jgi:hypothetical protein
MNQTSPAWLQEMVATAGSKRLTSIDGPAHDFRSHFSDHWKVASEENIPFHISKKDLDKREDRIHNEDHFLPEFIDSPKDIEALETQALCTNRLQRQLGEWFQQQMPRLLDKQYSAVTIDQSSIDILELDICQTLDDYLYFGMIKKPHRNPTLKETHDLLETMWERTIAPYRAAAQTPPTPSR